MTTTTTIPAAGLVCGMTIVRSRVRGDGTPFATRHTVTNVNLTGDDRRRPVIVALCGSDRVFTLPVSELVTIEQTAGA